MAVRRGPRILYRRRHLLLRIAGATPGDRRRAVLSCPRGGRSWIVDRKGGGKPPPQESGSFDLSKMSEAEIAAEIAARMARWRQARQRPAGPARGLPAIGPAAQSPATPSDTPAAVQPVRMPELDMVMVTRIDRTLRIAAAGPRIASGTDKSATGSGAVLLRRGVQGPAARGPEPERHRHRTGAQRRPAAAAGPHGGLQGTRARRSAMARIGARGTGRHHALAGAATGTRARHRCGATVRPHDWSGDTWPRHRGMAGAEADARKTHRRGTAARPRARCRSARARQRGVAVAGDGARTWHRSSEAAHPCDRRHGTRARHRDVARADADAGRARRSGEAAHPCVRRHGARTRHRGMASG